jgi:hypothetical protein
MRVVAPSRRTHARAACCSAPCPCPATPAPRCQDGKLVSKTARAQLPKALLESGTVVTLGNFVCEVDKDVPYDEFR